MRSGLPIGAGLGSSAALSSALSAALLFTKGRIEFDERISAAAAEQINAYAFLAEKVIHGNPSGVDNAVAVHGGALSFARAHERTGRASSEMRTMRGFAAVRFLLTDTRVGRDTKSLVAGVGAKLQADPQGVGAALQDIQSIADEAAVVLAGDSSISRAKQLQTLQALIVRNHALLVGLGVSHPSLEAVRHTTEAAGLATKLTGAGGGGCAVTLIPDETDEQTLQRLVADLEKQGFACYQTKVGGPGVGAMLAHEQHRRRFKNAETSALVEGLERGDWVFA